MVRASLAAPKSRLAGAAWVRPRARACQLWRLQDTALTTDAEIELAGLVPRTFVPGRNFLFFTYAAAIAYRRGMRLLIGGMCETDYSGYPDCRDRPCGPREGDLGLDGRDSLAIETPLMEIERPRPGRLRRSSAGRPLSTSS